MQAITKEEAMALLRPERREELRERAHEVTVHCVEKRSKLVSVVNRPSCPIIGDIQL